MTLYTTALKPFVLDGTDVQFIIDQVNFKPLFDVVGNAIINWDGSGAIYDSHGQQIWNGMGLTATDAINLYGTSYQTVTDLSGLRDPSGLYNNLLSASTKALGSTDSLFPRMAPSDYANYVAQTGANYAITAGGTKTASDGTPITISNVTDSTPRMISLATTTGGVEYDIWKNHQFEGAPAKGVLFDAADIHAKAVVNWDGTGAAYDLKGNLITGGAVAGDAASVAALAQYGHSYDAGALANAAFVQADPVSGQHVPNEIYYNADGTATVLSWGVLDTVANGGLGQVDTQARYDGTSYDVVNGKTVVHTGPGVGTITTAVSAGIGDHFIGGQNPGVSGSNGFFVLFGQFFDHGLDFIGKASGKTITINLDPSDPLYNMVGPDGNPTTSITINRATVATVDANGPEYANHASPFIDQSQTYGSHDQVTNLLREWVKVPGTDTFHAGTKLLDGTTLETAWKDANGNLVHDTLPTLNELRAHVVATGRDALTWEDVMDYRNRDASGHVTTGSSGSALILDSNPRFDDAHLFKSTGFNDANHDGTLDNGEITQAKAVQNAIDYLGTQVRQGDSFAMANDPKNPGHQTLTYTFGTDLTVPTGPGTSHTYHQGDTATGANALMFWVNFGNFAIMDVANQTPLPGATHDAVSEILMASVGDHYIAGDGRVNENFGLTSIHHVFHEEHNYQVGNLEDALHRDATVTGNYDNLHQFQIAADATNGIFEDATTHDYKYADGTIAWDSDKVFNGAKLIVEMEYQHAAVDQYARNVTPNIQEFVGYSPDKNPGVTLDYAQAVFRFGHSTLRETIDTMDPTHGLTGKIMGYALRDAFLNPDKYAQVGPSAVLLGMSHQQMNEIDQYVTPALNQGLLGQPLDLAAINIARGRDVGIPTLNEFRDAVGLVKYTSWTDFGNNMQDPVGLKDFIAAYAFGGDAVKAGAILDLAGGTYTVTDGHGNLDEAATQAAGLALAHTLGLPDGTETGGDPVADLLAAVDHANAFVNGDAAGAGVVGSEMATGALAFNYIDTWLGGLAETHQPGGILGETFDKVFVNQIESLMDGDRFYYLYRLAGQSFGEEVGNAQLKDIVERNTGLTHLNGNIFGYADQYIDFSATKDIVNTTSNDHKYGETIAAYEAAHPLAANATLGGNVVNVGTDAAPQVVQTIGVYSNDGLGTANNGHLITIGGQQYIQDVRAANTDPNSAYGQNSFTNLDGTPNSGAGSNEDIVGTKGNDLLYGQGGDDTVYGDGGNDIIYGGYGIDRLYGGTGNDEIHGGDNPDLIDGGSGDDKLYGDSSGSDINGADQIVGGSGNDEIYGGVGIDKLSGGTGDDAIYGGQDTDPFTHGSDGNDIVDGGSGGDIVYGDNGDDLVIGGADQDQLFGGNGDDILRPGDPTGALTIGSDEVLGGDGQTDYGNGGVGTIGFDLIDFSDNSIRPGGVTFDLSNQANPGTTLNGTPTQVPSAGIEGAVGSAGNDTLTSGSTHTDAAGNTINDANWLIGGAGNDKLIVTAGANNIIVGGSVRLDTLVGKYAAVQYDANGNAVLDAHGNAILTGAASTYNHNNNNDGLTAAQQLMDARYQGASHRVGYADQLDQSGLIDAANALGGTQLDKHFTEMLRSAQFQNQVLGDAAGLTNAGNDTVVFAGSSNDFNIEQVTYAGHSALKLTAITANADGTHDTNLIVDVANFQFSNGTFTYSQMITPPTVSISSPAPMNEGDVGTTAFPFVISLDRVYAHDVMVSGATGAIGDTATGGSDYQSVSGTLTIAAGQTTVPVSIDVFGDKVYEHNETFTVNLTGATVSANDPANPGATQTVTLAVATGTGTILNDDAAPVFTINDVKQAEGDVGQTAFTFTVTKTGATALSSTVHYATSNGTAVAGVTVGGVAGTDYVAASGDLTFAAGEVSKQVTVFVLANTVFEADKAFNLTLSAPSDATLGAASVGHATILNDDPPLTAIVWTGIAPTTNAFGGVNTQIAALATLAPAPFVSNYNYSLGAGSSAGFAVSAAGVVTTTAALAANANLHVNLHTAATASVAVLDQTFDVLTGSAGTVADTLTANAAPAGSSRQHDTIFYGGNGNDTMVGGNGNDTFYGQVGTDTVSYAAASAGVTVSLAIAGAQNTIGAGNDTLNGVENLTGSAFNDTLTGDTNANVLTGGIGDDTLNGGLGNDTLDGGTGNDTAVFSQSVVASTFTLNAANQLVVTGTDGTDTLIGVENGSFSGSTYGLSIGTNTAGALTGNDTLTGTAGVDVMVGGTGNDNYTVNNAGDIVIENANGGIDTVNASISYTLGANLEYLTLTGTANINGTGNAAANVITGNSGNNVIDGGAGADTMAGGAGNDTYVVDNAGDVVTENVNEGTDTVNASISYTLGANVENLTLTGTANLNGTGNALVNIITGTSGNNTLNGGGGADTLIGGAGNDTYIVNNTGVTVTENAGEGTDIVQTSLLAYTLGLNIENLTYTGAGDFVGVGNIGNNTIIGGTGNDTLDGKGGTDTLNGGAGNDTYIVDNAGVTIVDSAGIDTVNTSLASYTLGTGLENLNFTGVGNFAGTGNNSDNAIIGGVGADTLNGGSGNDTLKGGAGNDIINGGTGTADVAVYDGVATNFAVDSVAGSTTLLVTDGLGTEGVDTLTGIETLRFAGVDYNVLTGTTGNNAAINGLAAVNNLIMGLEGNDTLNGGSLNDILNGGAGNDTINAGSGDDRIIQYAKDAGRDVIDGGLGTDTYQLIGDNSVQERFTIYDRTSAISNGFGAGLNAATTIVVTKETFNGTSWNAGSVISELRGIEEIDVKTGGFGPNLGGLTSAGVSTTTSGDTIRVIGNFVGTGLAYNTITIDGAGNNSTVDISALTSAHRIVFNAGGAGGSVIGTLRPQDVINGTSVTNADPTAATVDANALLNSGASTVVHAAATSDNLANVPVIDTSASANDNSVYDFKTLMYFDYNHMSHFTHYGDALNFQ